MRVAPACNASAERQRRYRARQRKPALAVYQIEIERDVVLQALIDSGRISHTQIDTRDLVARALSLMIVEWTLEVNNK